jgi:pyruvate/2-oxoglutarate dehydrogenase complex dihydrolipoamide acyltransferase (E2) component
MSTTEERAPLGAAPDDVYSQSSESATNSVSEAPVDRAATPNVSMEDLHATLSPAVRRLVRQFDLDITGIHGTGPSGRIRVGDVMGLLGGRTDSGNRDAPARAGPPEDDDVVADDDGAESELAPSGLAPFAAHSGTQAAILMSTVFDCDVSRVLSHRKKLRLEQVELLTTSYVLTALAAALDATPEVTAGEPPRFGVALATTDGELRSTFLDTATVSWDTAVDERVRAVDAALRANLDAGHAASNLLVHHYGETGSLLATPTPIGVGHAASFGVGRVRREVVVRSVEGVETPRVAARCYLSLSFLSDRMPFHHANRLMAGVVRTLEMWPE